VIQGKLRRDEIRPAKTTIVVTLFAFFLSVSFGYMTCYLAGFGVFVMLSRDEKGTL